MEREEAGRFGPLVGAIDEGTSSVRFIIFCPRNSEIIVLHQIPLKCTYPQNGWVEQDPLEIITLIEQCIKESFEKLKKMEVTPSDICSIGVTNQRETVIAWDKFTGKPFYNAIVWSDTRAWDIVAKLTDKSSKEERDSWKTICGLPLNSGFSAPKFKWILEHVPEVKVAALQNRLCLGTMDSWVIYNLTGGPNGGIHITDCTNASRTFLMNLNSLEWDIDLCKLFDIDREWLPNIKSSSEIYGTVASGLLKGVKISGNGQRPMGTSWMMKVHGRLLERSAGAERAIKKMLHLLGQETIVFQFLTKNGIRIVHSIGERPHRWHRELMFFRFRYGKCLGDQQSALLGHLCTERGQVKSTYGTGCFLLCNIGPEKLDSRHGLLTTVAFKLGVDQDAMYALEGSVAVAGAALNWLRDNLGILEDATSAEAVAEAVAETNDVYFVPAFSGMYAPYWEQNARGVIVGITESTKNNHLIRAALEAVCFQTRDIIEAMEADCGFALKQLLVDGGMTKNNLLMQLQADIAGIPVVRPNNSEMTALGVAIAAGSAKGIDAWKIDFSVNSSNKIFYPTISGQERDSRYQKWKEAVERSFSWNSS